MADVAQGDEGDIDEHTHPDENDSELDHLSCCFRTHNSTHTHPATINANTPITT
jgi:hypothetical protein